MMIPPLYACEFCGDEVNPSDQHTWTLVTGWVQPRKLAAPKYATPPHGWACNPCMMEKKYGNAPDSLF